MFNSTDIRDGVFFIHLLTFAKLQTMMKVLLENLLIGVRQLVSGNRMIAALSEIESKSPNLPMPSRNSSIFNLSPVFIEPFLKGETPKGFLINSLQGFD